jgi:hypothetical protein
VTLVYGLGLLAALVIAWIAVRRGRHRRRLKTYRESWEQRGTVLRIKRDQKNMRATDPELQTRPPMSEDGTSSGRHKGQ